MKKKILSIVSLVSVIALSGCVNKELSVVKGDYGVELGQNAGVLTVKGYDPEVTMLVIEPSKPDPRFESYNVGVDKETKTVNRITALAKTESDIQCQEMKETITKELKLKYKDVYLSSEKLNKEINQLSFNNGFITVSCSSDLALEYHSK